jgi:spermidine synthase
MTPKAHISRPPLALLFAVGSLSFLLLGFQISLMRLLSYAQWYHFASMVISLALLGFGGAGTVLAVFRVTIVRQAGLVIQIAPFVCLLATAFSPVTLSWTPIDPFLVMSDIGAVFRLLFFIGLLVIPFFAGALVIGLSFLVHPALIGRFYFANLLGSAFGSIGAVALLEVVSPERLPPVLAALALPGVCCASGKEKRSVFIVMGIAACLLFTLVWRRPAVPMSQFKPLAKALLLPGSLVTERSTTPLGIVETVQGRALRYAPGVSLNFEGKIPSQAAVFNDGEWVGSLIREGDTLMLQVLEHSTSNLPYQLGKPGKVLIVGAGTGSDMLLARRSGAASVTGVEMNAGVVRRFNREYSSASADGVSQTGMHMINTEARSFLVRDTSTYSLIIVPILEGQTANAAGTQALFENYLFTVESFSLLVSRLDRRGILVVHTWMNTPPRGSVKILGSAIEALSANGIENPGTHLAVVRSWNTVALAASREPLTAVQIERVRAFSANMGFDLVWLPGLTREETNQFHQLQSPYLFEAAEALLGKGPGEYFRTYPFRVEPATDERPYFSSFVSWWDIPRLLTTYQSREIPYLELGTFFLASTALLVGLLSSVLIGVPLLFLQKTGSPRGLLTRSIFYFGGLGLGYMIMEMVIIQKSVLFLGDPIYSVAAVVASVLLFSSVGSACSSAIQGLVRGHPWWVPAVVLVVLVLYALILSPVLSAGLGLPLWARFVILPIVLGPLGFVLGVPFPLGLSRVSENAPDVVPWAWGVNGYCSVLAASTSVLVSMEFGFGGLQIIAILAYAAAFGAFGSRVGTAKWEKAVRGIERVSYITEVN